MEREGEAPAGRTSVARPRERPACLGVLPRMTGNCRHQTPPRPPATHAARATTRLCTPGAI